MKYSESEIRQYVAEEDVKFLRMTFFDLTGNQKNMSILPDLGLGILHCCSCLSQSETYICL